MKILFIILILRMVIMSFGSDNITCDYVWRYLDYTWDNETQMKQANDTGNYDPTQCITDDGKKVSDGRVIVTSPKEFGPGCPVTLTVVSNDKKGAGGPLLRPYPDWKWHSKTWNKTHPDCTGLVNVARIDLKCGHLFAMDTGKVGRDERLCSPKLVIIRLKDDKVVKIIHIPEKMATNNETGKGVLVKPLVFLPSEDCSQLLDNMIIFMADYYGNGLVVYNSVKDSMCRIESKYMEPVDDLFVLKNHDTFIYPAGIFSMTVICNECKTSCYLYWAPISGKAIYRTDIDHLLNCPNKDQANNKTKYTIKLASQTVDMESVDHTLYYSDTGAMSIVRRNVCKLSSQSKPVRY
ncbi:hypothetical protein PUN28_010853 [Cardiocondyla obscurior]|uniref:Bee-milk protein n=1 Tax=Cardiocondyla obscurior TaxID=286306 RepID=A0AAW2FMK8_9HYME